jgi:hypothetical protein
VKILVGREIVKDTEEVGKLKLLNSDDSFFVLAIILLIPFCFSFFYFCAGWGYIVAFTKVLTMYQIYHTLIHPLHSSPLSPWPHS